MKQKKGFTLIELVVVMAIIAILSLLIIAAITAARRQSVTAQRTGNARTIETALETYSSRKGGLYPAKVNGDVKLSGNLVDALKNSTALNSDLSGLEVNQIIYVSNETGTKYTLTACDIDTTELSVTNGAITAGTANEINQTGPCVSGKVIYSTAR